MFHARTRVACLLAAAALTAMTAAGCLGGEEKKTVDVAANTKEVCAATTKIMSDGMKKYGEAIAAGIAAQAAADKAAQDKAEADGAAAFKAMAGDLRKEASNAADPELEKLMESVAGGLEEAADKPAEEIQESDNADGTALEKKCA